MILAGYGGSDLDQSHTLTAIMDIIMFATYDIAVGSVNENQSSRRKSALGLWQVDAPALRPFYEIAIQIMD